MTNYVEVEVEEIKKNPKNESKVFDIDKLEKMSKGVEKGSYDVSTQSFYSHPGPEELEIGDIIWEVTYKVRRVTKAYLEKELDEE